MQTVQQFSTWFSKQKLFVKSAIGCSSLFICCLCGVLIFILIPSTPTSESVASTPVDVSSLQTIAVETALAGVNQTEITNAPTQTFTPTITFTPSSTSTLTPIPSDEMTQTAVSGNATATAESIQMTKTAIAVQATSTRQAYNTILTATAVAHPSTLTFLEIENNYYDMDDNQWNQYRASLKGVKVQWSGKILDKVFDTLLLDMGQYAPDRMIALHDIPTITVEKLVIGNSVTFIAEITDVTLYCDIQLKLIDMK